MSEHLTLKWGSLKSWDFEGNDACVELLKEYYEDGVSISAMMQHDTKKQKELICQMIDKGNFDEVYLDWDDKYVSKEDAKKYVMEYDNN